MDESNKQETKHKEVKDQDQQGVEEQALVREQAPENSEGTAANPSTEAQEKEKQAIYEKYLYLAAEFENFKRRVAQERNEWLHSGERAVLTDLLSILDEFERAQGYVVAAELPEEAKQHLEGFWLVAKSIKKVLEKFGVEEVVRDAFDPEIHEAIDMINTDDYSSGAIVKVVKKGYRHKDRLLRPAQVIVAQ